MSEPTQEQVKEFWEGYGFKFYQPVENGAIDVIYPDGSMCLSPIKLAILPIDLNNLFKYAVPQALKVIAERGYCPSIMKLFQLWYDELVTQTGDSSNVEQAALALFWVLDKIRRQSDGKGS